MDENKNHMRIKLDFAPEINRELPEKTKALKQTGEYTGLKLEVLGVPFGGPLEGRDAQGEAFTANTDIWMKQGDTVPITYIHGYGPDSLDTWQENPAIIGEGIYTRKDDRGHWFDVTLDAGEPLAQRVEEAALKGVALRASSGAVGHVVRMGKAGLIKVWPVGELAVFDTNEWRQPANDFAVVNAKFQEVEAEAGNSATTEREAKSKLERLLLAYEVTNDHGRKRTNHRG